jgi:hypothetical protein
MRLIRKHIDGTGRDVGSPKQFRLNPVFGVKVVICRAMAYLALGKYITVKQLQAEVDYWMEDSTYGIGTPKGRLKQPRMYIPTSEDGR